MQIPIASQQIAPPKPARQREQVNVEAGKAAAVGQFAQQAAQVASGFAGRLADLAAQNEINGALVSARDQWREFWGELQKDPDYTLYGEKFETFCSGLNDTLYGKMHMPRSKTMLKQRLEELRLKWEGTVQQYSDNRAIDHGRAVRQQTITQMIRDLDPEGVVSQLAEARASMEFGEEDLLKIQETAISQIVRDQTMNYARMLGEAGVSWLLSGEAGEKFAYQVGESTYFLDPDVRKSMAASLNAELNLLQAQGLKAAEGRREEQYTKARLEIENEEIVDIDDIYDESQFPDLTISDKRALETELDYKLKEADELILQQKQDVLNDVNAALGFNDFDYAQQILNEAIERSEVDVEDPEINRAQYILDQARKPVTDEEAQKEINKTRIELRLLAGDLEGIETDLVAHGREYAEFKDTSDFISHIREQIEQAEEAEVSGPEPKTTNEAIAYFEEIFFNEYVTLEELKELKRWLRGEFGTTVFRDKKSTWETKIDKKIKDLQKAEPNFYVEAAKRGIVKQYNEEIKDLTDRDNIEDAGLKEREKYEMEGMLDAWHKDFVRKNEREPTPEEVDAAYKNFTEPLLSSVVRRQLSRGLRRGVMGGTPWQTRVMSPAEVMRWWSEEGRLDRYGRLVGVPLEQQLQTLGIQSFEELDLAWLREQGVDVLSPLEDPQFHYVEGPNGEMGVYDERTGEIRDPYTKELIIKL